MARLHTLIVSAIVGLGFVLGSQPFAAAQAAVATRYLAFQMFTGAPDTRIPIGGSGAAPLLPPPDKDTMSRFVQRLIEKIGTTGNSETKLAFVIGPLAFDHTDAQLRQMISDAFAIALEQNIAVGFHIDDSMFWARRSDLWADPANVEWLDWDGTPNTGRRLDWSAEPTAISPQMCFNSPAVQAAVQHEADVMGSAISEGIATLVAQGKSELFAGVIVGWETQIGLDFKTSQYLGYCALTNRDFSKQHPPSDPDSERVQVVQDFIELWASGMAQSGVNPDKIYSHTAVVSTQTYDSMPERSSVTYAQINHFALPSVSFGKDYHPGFSTYPQAGLMEQLYAELEKHGSPTWASSEGANIDPASLTSGASMETYLAGLFNHGAALVNIFGWGIGDEASANPFRTAAEAPDAITAYQKFLGGETLVEGDSVVTDLPARIHQIQAKLPTWIEQNPSRRSEVEPLVVQLQQYIDDNNFQQASKTADDILAIINP